MSKMYNAKSVFIAIGVAALIFVTGCKKETPTPVNKNNNTSTRTTTTTTTASPYFLTGTLSGEAINAQGTAAFFNESTPSTSTGGCEAGSGSNNGNGASTGDPDDDKTKLTGGKWVLDQSGINITTAIIEMKKLAVRVYVAPIAFNYYNLVAPGVYGFSTSSVSGAFISVLDSRGNVWTTNGDQTGSTFEITSRTDSTATSVKFAGTFSAKMYDTNGNVKQITNGNFSSLAALK